jgi:hypothetical protein
LILLGIGDKVFRYSRKRAIKKEKIKDLLSGGLNAKEILNATGFSRTYIRNAVKEFEMQYTKEKQTRRPEKPEKKKTGSITIKHAKKKAWEACSRFIRVRDCIKTTGSPSRGRCTTCGRPYPFKCLQAGHWLQGRHPSVLFDPRNIHAQCYYCNIQLRGNPVKYYHFMEYTYGLEVMAILEVHDGQKKQFTVQELIDIRREFEEKEKILLGGRKI